MVEQPGAWGRDAVFESRLPRTAAETLHRRAHGLKIRVILIRRPDRPPGGLAVFLAHTGGTRTRPVLLHGQVDDPADLLDLDLRPLTAGEPVGFGTPLERPLFLVCTNGRHDVCCAERGRPVFRAIAAQHPDRTWECSHIGGDRFAANVVCFPHGIYYGWVEPADATAVARAYERGRLSLDHYRGRSSWPPEIQAAEQFLRVERTLAGVDDVVPERRLRRPDGGVEVTFRVGPRSRYTVRVAPMPRERVFLTCRAESRSAPQAFAALSVEPV
jgi:hypothetical protein